MIISLFFLFTNSVVLDKTLKVWFKWKVYKENWSQFFPQAILLIFIGLPSPLSDGYHTKKTFFLKLL